MLKMLSKPAVMAALKGGAKLEGLPQEPGKASRLYRVNANGLILGMVDAATFDALKSEKRLTETYVGDGVRVDYRWKGE